ncbi:MAG: hypothetical protein JWM14_1279 [Chitinophagaceae bacterium]|nr:hypothetical protein [Chitinophagaceae bacterium]
MFSLKRKLKVYKGIAMVMTFIFLLEVVLPVPAAYALTGGPSQPEVQSFEPIGTSEMVNMFSGDFTYNIPLMDVGGYPINISYNGGATTDEEASWVGLGWNINPGVINRNMRSLPDDFNGDGIIKEKNMRPNITYGVQVGGGIQVFGLDFLKISGGLDFNYNNYNGVGFGISFEPSISASNSSGTSATAGLGFSASSANGVDISPSVGFSSKREEETKRDYNVGGSIGLSINSREGLKSLTLGGSASRGADKKTGKGAFSKSGSYTFTFATPTHAPAAEFPMSNLSGTFKSNIGGEIFGLDANAYLNGYYSRQQLLTKSKTFSAYGYLYSHNFRHGLEDHAMHDFNREKDEPFNKKYSTNLALTNYTYDVYSVSGQGIGGTYRPYRNDIGVVHDPLTVSLGDGSISLGGEVGLGNAVHFGTDLNVAVTVSRDGSWPTLGGVDRLLDFRASDASNPAYEPVYFKQAGELNPNVSNEFLNNIGGFEPYRIKLNQVGLDYYPSKKLTNGQTDIDLNSGPVYKSDRQARNQNISFLTAAEAQNFALEKVIKDYKFNDHNLTTTGYSTYDPVARIDNDRKAHHLSEIAVLRPDGARYFYGIPAYNTYQKEVTFSVESSSPNCATGLTSYNPDNNNSSNNDRGLDNYFESNTIPGYAHSFMLTTVASSDYVDLTGDGPTDDDFGSYTKINYSRIEGYQWRVPFLENTANYNEGFKSTKNDNEFTDDKASYVYGRKDLWYVHSIETRTHVAEFILEDRLDGVGVKGENGGADANANNNRMKRLVRIELYSKPDKIKNGANATPIKIVNFSYDYSLCTGIENTLGNTTTGKGKLTLKSIYFTYGKSFKGKMNAYKFNYDYKNANFNYNIKGYDRWGNYKPNDGTPNCYDTDNMATTPLSTSEYPYVDQDTTKANRYARAWCMNEIQLPSGGKITVDYEADDYAYVQDRAAMQMFKISGTSKSPISNWDGTSTGASTPINNSPLMEGGNGASYSYVYFQLQNPIPAGTSKAAADHIISRDYIKKMPNMYFRFLVNLQQPGKDPAYEYVPGYVSFNSNDSYGAVVPTSGDIKYAYVRIKGTGVQLDGGGDEVNPISLAAWQFSRLYLPKIAFKQPDPSDKLSSQALQALVSTFTAVQQFIGGFNRCMRNEDFGKQFVKEKSWIRLYNPIGKKLGGGHRVKRIVLNDQWSSLAGQSNYENSKYGQEYDYTQTITVEGEQRVISSGVAAYEPLPGGDENAMRTPIFQTQSLLLAPSNTYYLEEPFGESFFPSASVGYSKVTVKNLQFNNVKGNATGKVVHEFYTAKDFPTITKRTGIDTRPSKVNDILKLFKIQLFDYMNVSQGYVVELNDMHGKPKADWVYQEGNDAAISGVEYQYKTNASSTAPYLHTTQTLKTIKLDNNVNVMSKYPGDNNKFISSNLMGVDVDVITDMRSSSSISVSGGVQVNLDMFLTVAVPIFVPDILPSFNAQAKAFNTAVMTKVINRYGVLEKTIAHDLGASVTTKNLLWDKETGEVLLTETTNQFDDPIYNFNYPAHWTYDQMGLSYKNVGFTLKTPVLLTSGVNNAPQYFTKGDELMLMYIDPADRKVKYKPQVYSVLTVGSNSLSIVDRTGQAPDLSQLYIIKVLRSGRRNLQTTSVGTVTTLVNPMVDVDGNGSFDRLDFNKILNASAVEYSEFWKTFCADCGFNPVTSQAGASNPYLNGLLGLWRPNRNWVYLTERTQAVANNNTNIRKDGVYASYVPFWAPPASSKAGDWSAPNKDKWQFATEVTEFSPFGYEVENRDALGRYSAAVYGYNNSFAVAIGNNAQYRELAFDNFEDYDYAGCIADHFSYRTTSPSAAWGIDNGKSHTGRRSLRVAPNQSAFTKKYINNQY